VPVAIRLMTLSWTLTVAALTGPAAIVGDRRVAQLTSGVGSIEPGGDFRGW
jgi:hypothetical protein